MTDRIDEHEGADHNSADIPTVDDPMKRDALRQLLGAQDTPEQETFLAKVLRVGILNLDKE